MNIFIKSSRGPTEKANDPTPTGVATTRLNITVLNNTSKSLGTLVSASS